MQGLDNWLFSECVFKAEHIYIIYQVDNQLYILLLAL